MDINILDNEYFEFFPADNPFFIPKKKIILKDKSGTMRVVNLVFVNDITYVTRTVSLPAGSSYSNDNRQYYNSTPDEGHSRNFDLSDPETAKYIEIMDILSKKSKLTKLNITEIQLMEIMGKMDPTKSLKECFVQQGFILKD